MPIRVSARLRRLRLERDMSQEEVAAGAGIALSTYARAELGTHTPTLKTLSAIARALGVSVSEIIGESPHRG